MNNGVKKNIKKWLHVTSAVVANIARASQKMPSSFLISSPLGSIHLHHIENILGRAVGAKLYSHHRSSRQRSIRKRGMPSERVINTQNGAMRAFKMNDSTFMSSLMPKQEIGAVKFLDDHPTYDGRGVVVAIFDSGVDPAAAGLQITSDGKPKVIDIIDCTGSGDIDTSKAVKADVDGFIIGASGACLMVNSEWKNPSGEWHVGYKFVYELFTDSLTARLKKERRKKWKEEHATALLPASKDLSSFDQKHPSPQSKALKKEREDLQNRVDFLRKQDERYEDKGPVIDVVVWNDGNLWRAAVDTKDLEEDSEKGKLENFVPLANYRLERKYGVFSRLDACTFSVNIYDEGNILSIVTDCSPHGTHVAGITAAHHPEEPLLNGIAPGAQIVSCKIGDTRLGSMETGTGLTRALIAVVENKCDLINMSYGEPTMMPDYGRFIKLLNEVVNKYKVIFVSSAGNEGPALSTVTAPGGTSSSIIGIGAYVSPNMAAAAHCLVEPPSEGLEYTWSSRGPTVDGDLGVCLSAPGGAVAPVPTWTLQRRMLMNGTSMASPCACGGVALLLSSMKAEGRSISPYVVRKALENTAVPISDELVEKLSTGQGLIQVDQAYDYLQKCKDIPAVRYQVEITQNGSSGPSMRGIYLREPSDSLQTSEWTIQVKPKFHDDADNLTELVPFEECIQLKSSSCEIMRVPEYLLLTYNGRTFNILVDPTSLSQGVHYFEVEGIDYNAPCRGSLFRIPITVIKPYTVQGTIISFPGISFLAGHIERRFINVPFGASWVEATIRASGFDTPRRFFINSLQICPKSRPSVWESVVTFSSPAMKRFSFSVEGGRTMEITIAQFWSSGNGSHAEAVIDLEVEFHGLLVDKKEIALPCTEAYTKIDVKALLSSENLCPLGQLSSIKVPYRPFESVVAPLPTKIDRLPSQAQIYGLTLTYKFTLNESYSVTPCIPLLNNRVYDTEFESQFYMIADINKRIVGMGDVYPKSVRLSKGDYFVRLLLRHDNTQFLEKLKNLILFIKMDLEEKNIVKLNFYSEPDGAVTGENFFKPMVLLPGQSQAFYIASPSDDKLPKNISAGSSLVGNITVGKLSLSGAKKTEKDESCPPSYLISYMVPPAKVDEKDKEKDKGKGGAAVKKSVKKYWEDELRDSKVKVLMNLPRDSVEDFEEWKQFAAALKSEYPNYTPLLARILDGIVSWNSKTDNVKHNIEIIKAAEEVIASIDKDELAKYFGMKCEMEDEEAVETKKKMEAVRTHLSDALYNKGLALAELENLKTQTEEEDSLTQDTVGGTSQPDDEAKKKEDAFEENYLELCKWADVICSKYGLLAVQRERRCKRLGSALKVVEDLIRDDSKPPEKKLFELKLSLIKEVGWTHLASYERDWLLIRFPPNYPLF